MTDPIPAEAVEAAARAEFARRGFKAAEWETMPDVIRLSWQAIVRPAVEAAAPLIAAQATADLCAGIEALRDEWRARAASLRAVDSYAATLCDEHADALDALNAGGEGS